MDEIYKMVSANVRKYRVQAGMTQQQLADALDVGYAYISKLERGRSGVKLGTLNKIAEALSVSIGDLVGTRQVSSRHLVGKGLEREISQLSRGDLNQLSRLFQQAKRLLSSR